MRTFDRDTFLRAQAMWDDGDFGYRWTTIRRIAADRGFIFPPNGTVHDDRDADPPSQRAIVYGALSDNPTTTEAIVRRSRSWGEVVDGIIGLEKRLAEDADELERDTAWNRKDEPTGREATSALKSILNRIGDS
jgi:hypothetical protein